MNAKVKRLWLKALRGGEFRQAQFTLREGRKAAYCCLGVLCELHRRKIGGKWSANGDYMGSAGVLPFEVQEWAGLPNDNPNAGQDSLGSMNDKGKPFDYIADRIEKYL